MRSLDPLHVRSDESNRTLSPTELMIDPAHLRHADAAAIVGGMPGAAIVRNGSQTGILQLRGLSGDRVAVRVDGMTITPACPNHMDPPLHYAHPAGGDLIELMAGISPVSAGGDHIGGSLSVKSAEPEFADEGALLTKGVLGSSFRGNQDAVSLAANLSIAGESAAFRYRGSAATAGDLRYPGGTVSASGYDTTSHLLTAAWRTPGGFIAADAGFSATRDSGTPSLPMDMIRDDAWRFGITSRENLKWGTLENRFYIHDIDHLMDNFSLRPLMLGAMAMEAPSSSLDFGWRGMSPCRSGKMNSAPASISTEMSSAPSRSQLPESWRARGATPSMTTAAADTEPTPSGTKNIPQRGAPASACAAMW